MTSAPTSTAATIIQRTIFGSLVLLILGLIFWLDTRIALHFLDEPGWLAARLSRGSLLPLFIAAVGIAAAWEMTNLLRAKGAHPPLTLTCALVPIMVLLPWLWPAAADQHLSLTTPSLALIVGPLLAILITGAYIVLRHGPTHSIREVAATLVIVFYIGFLLSFPVDVRSNLAAPGPDGAWLLLAIVLMIKASDIGAYFTGTFLGRHKLIPSVSPGKSVEGAFGGLILSGVVAVLIIQWTSVGQLHPFASWGTADTLSDESTRNMTRIAGAFALGITLSLIGQLADLIESCFKRDVGIKDSGYVMPRLGGVLDMIDSPLLAIPMGWLILTLA